MGAVSVVDGRLVASRHNERERTGDPTAHAEMLALRDTAAVIGNWRLTDVAMVVLSNRAPCVRARSLPPESAGSSLAPATLRAGACGTLYNLCADPRLNHELTVTYGVRADESGALLSSFFAAKRGERPADVSAHRSRRERLNPAQLRCRVTVGRGDATTADPMGPGLGGNRVGGTARRVRP